MVLPLNTSWKLLKHCPSEGTLRRCYPNIGIPIPQTRERNLFFFGGSLHPKCPALRSGQKFVKYD
jgi:hypothetical protein